ncbi:hypothetical protein RQP46_008286 [Phenoliferia psychrophenolica]
MTTRLQPLALKPFLRHLSAANPTPALLARSALPPLAALSWFTPEGVSFPDPSPETTLVSLESHSPPPFQRINAPLSFFATYLALRPPAAQLDLYLAQQTPPPSFLPHLPPPPFLAASEITQTSLWIGLAPTVSPLHEDPDDNILAQLTGRKVVRLLDPTRGKDILARVRGTDQGARLRGEELMSAEPGGERDQLERAVWGADEGVVEATIETGEALFIPRGWWHGVHGVHGTGDADADAADPTRRPISASVNWWFRQASIDRP